MSPNNSNNIRIITIVAVVVVALGALAYALLGKKMTNPQTQSNLTSPSTPATVAPGPVASAPVTSQTQEYKDGTYTATGSYFSPGGDEKLGVTLTLKDDIISAASVTPEPATPNGEKFQTIFEHNFQPLVVGMNISTVHLTKVSGSSLTGGGFDDALAQIEVEAKN